MTDKQHADFYAVDLFLKPHELLVFKSLAQPAFATILQKFGLKLDLAERKPGITSIEVSRK